MGMFTDQTYRALPFFKLLDSKLIELERDKQRRMCFVASNRDSMIPAWHSIATIAKSSGLIESVECGACL
jgi:hypothetical protein